MENKQMVEDFSKCIGCQECLSACQSDALTLSNRQIVKHNELCTSCYECLEICPTMVFEIKNSAKEQL